MSSTVSCSSAAHSVSVSSRMPAQIFATPTGWMMKSSPDLRRWSAWCSQANTNASSTRVAVDRDSGLVGVLLDDREQVAEQPALGRRSARRARSATVLVGDRLGRRRRRRRSRRGAPSRARGRAAPLRRGSARPLPARRRRAPSPSPRPPALGARSLRPLGCGICAAQESPSVLVSRLRRPGRRASARASCASALAIARAGRSRSRLTSSSSARTLTSRPASRAGRPC